MDHLLTFEPRLETLENQAKSDLIAVTRKLEEVRKQAEGHIKKVDAYKLSYGLQVDMMKAVMDPLRHRSGQAASQKHPKRDTEVQCLLNLMDWQLKVAGEDHFRDDVDRLIEDAKIDYDDLFEPRCIRKQKLGVELDNKVYGRKPPDGERGHSAPAKLHIESGKAPALRRKHQGVRVWDRALGKRITLTIAQNRHERKCRDTQQ